MMNLKNFVWSLAVLTTILSCKTKPYKDLNPPKGWDCVVLNRDTTKEKLEILLEDNILEDSISLDTLLEFTLALDEKPICNCVNSEDLEVKDVECNGYISGSPEREGELRAWAEEKLVELAKRRRQDGVKP